jgi:hypothetical protein
VRWICIITKDHLLPTAHCLLLTSPFRIPLQIAGSHQPADPGDEKHAADNEKGFIHVSVPVIEESDNYRRNDVSQCMDDKNVQCETNGTHRGRSDICQYRIGWAGIKKQAKTGEENQNPYCPGEWCMECGQE